MDFLEVFGGSAGLTLALSVENCRVGQPIDQCYPAYGRTWDPSDPEVVRRFRHLYAVVLQPLAAHWALPCGKWGALGNATPGPEAWALANLTIEGLQHQEQTGRLGSFEGPVLHRLLGTSTWTSVFGPVESPRSPWQYQVLDGCMLNAHWQDPAQEAWPTKKALRLMANFDLSALNLRCRLSVESEENNQRKATRDQQRSACIASLAQSSDLSLPRRPQEAVPFAAADAGDLVDEVGLHEAAGPTIDSHCSLAAASTCGPRGSFDRLQNKQDSIQPTSVNAPESIRRTRGR